MAGYRTSPTPYTPRTPAFSGWSPNTGGAAASFDPYNTPSRFSPPPPGQKAGVASSNGLPAAASLGSPTGTFGDPNSILKTYNPGTQGLPGQPAPGSPMAARNTGPLQSRTPAYGSQSGPGILEQWFNQRASGTDPGYEYSIRRGMTSLGNASSAAGDFNSGAERQQESDFLANMASQREGQLDTLAGGASGEHQGRVNSMFQQGLGLSGGEAGLGSQYDLGAGSAMSQGNLASILMALNKAGVDSQSRNSLLSLIFGGAATGAKLAGV